MMKTLAFIFLTALANLSAKERPNILWITSEDNDKFWLGCYGNNQARTPNIDAFAKRAVRFENFFSNAPVCAVARSTILNGIYAPSQGTQHMRSRHPIPAVNKPYVSYLRAAGYYCTNASKTDYNFLGNDKAIWDECGPKAHYRNRKEGQPFFAIFNLTESHESSLFKEKIAINRERGHIPKETRLDTGEVRVRPYLPDLPEVRSDIAIYHDTISYLDRKIGEILSKLEEQNLAGDTIVFYYSDHGGITPRGKRYLHDTGVNVPLLIHTPEKWRQLSPFRNGSVTDEPAAFVDLAPTLLSLLGQEKPGQMQGRAFLGSERETPAGDDYIFLFADRFDEIYGMRRGLTDGRWKYIRRFTPHYAAAPYSYYQFGQAAWTAWQKAWLDDALDAPRGQIWEKNQVVEELFDTQADQWETVNLVDNPAHWKQLEKMRIALKAKMIKIKDTGLIPEPMFVELSPGSPVASYAKSRGNDWPQLVELAFLATQPDIKIHPSLIENLASPDPLERFWAAQGCLIRLTNATEKQENGLLVTDTRPVEKALVRLISDPHSSNRVTAAQALIEMGNSHAATGLLLKELDSKNQYAQQNTVNVLTQLNMLDKISNAWVRKNRSHEKRPGYVGRLANKLAKEREL